MQFCDNDSIFVTANDDSIAEPIDVKPSTAPMYEIYKASKDDILNRLGDWKKVYVDTDLEFYVSTKGYAKPLAATEDDLVKVEKPDEVSGMLPFTNTVCKHFLLRQIMTRISD